jgi:hypothetical protein
MRMIVPLPLGWIRISIPEEKINMVQSISDIHCTKRRHIIVLWITQGWCYIQWPLIWTILWLSCHRCQPIRFLYPITDAWNLAWYMRLSHTAFAVSWLWTGFIWMSASRILVLQLAPVKPIRLWESSSRGCFAKSHVWAEPGSFLNRAKSWFQLFLTAHKAIVAWLLLLSGI